MQKSTPVPVASTYAEAYPNSQKVYDETSVDTASGPIALRVPFREVTLGGGEKPVRLYDTSGPQGHDARHGQCRKNRDCNVNSPSIAGRMACRNVLGSPAAAVLNTSSHAITKRRRLVRTLMSAAAADGRR